MEARFFGQPFADGADLRDFLEAVASDETLTELTAAVAWAKRSGLRLIEEPLKAIRARSVNGTKLIVGIDQGGATKEGLVLARELFDEVHVFYDPQWRTFHPKLYLASSAGEAPFRAHLLVGSNNLTGGGVFYNYEAGLAVSIDADDSSGQELVADVRKYIDRLYNDVAVCVPITADDVLAQLVGDPRYKIGTEMPAKAPDGPDDAPDNVDTELPASDATNSDEKADGEDEESENHVQLTTAPSLFGKSSEPKRKSPKPPAPASSAAASNVLDPSFTVDPGDVLLRRWMKKLPKTDARRTDNPGTNVTGNIRLGKTSKRLPLDPVNYFRYQFFGDHTWATSATDPDTEETSVNFEIFVEDQAQGTLPLKISWKVGRVSDQKNHSTVVHWGPLVPLVTQYNFTNWQIRLERFTNGSARFRLTQDPVDPSEFVHGPDA